MIIAVREPDATRNVRMMSPLYELRLSPIGRMDIHGTAAWCGIVPPVSMTVTDESASMTKPGSTPARRQIAASRNIAVRENVSTSAAAFAAGERGRPRNVTPNALTKQAAASADGRARSAPAAGTAPLRPHRGKAGLTRMAWKVSHTDTKPLSGGT